MRTNPAPPGPFSKTIVLDLSRILAAPFAAQMLGDFGAEVIKVERPVHGDDGRRMGGEPIEATDGSGRSFGVMFMCANRNKKSITIDFQTPRGQELVRKLATRADVLIENYKVGDLARYGLDYASLSKINQRLVYCSVTGFGQTGPYASRPGFDSMFQAMSGIMGMSGNRDGAPGDGPMRVGVPISDFIGGIHAYGAIVTALYNRDQVTGRGQHIDLSLLDASISSMTLAGYDYLCNGVAQERWGNHHSSQVPSQTFRCKDGTVMVSAPTDDIFRRLCAALKVPDVALDPRFATNADRVRNRNDLDKALSERFLRLTQREARKQLGSNVVPCAPVNSIVDVFDDPQVQARADVISIPFAPTGETKVIANPMRLSDSPSRYVAPPLLGEHTVEILRDVLKMDAAEIESLKADGVI